VATAAARQRQLSIHRLGLGFGKLDGPGGIRGETRELLGRQAATIRGILPSANDIKT
jgi:hypothetical protein